MRSRYDDASCSNNCTITKIMIGQRTKRINRRVGSEKRKAVNIEISCPPKK
jgi:hypothetical protein